MRARLLMLFVVALLEAAQQTQAPDVVPGTVDGRVMNAQTGEPISGASVHLYPQIVQGRSSSALDAVSGADGSFRFENVPAGSYFVVANAPSFTDSGRTQVVRLRSGEQLSNMAVQLHPLAKVTGKVVDENGAPMPGVQVSVYSTYDWRGHPQLRLGPGATTDKEGRFQLTKINPGHYFLAADPSTIDAPERDEHDAGLVAVRTFYPKAVTLDAATPLDIVAGQDVTGIAIQMQRAAIYRVQGKIEAEAAGASTMNAKIALVPRGTLPLAGLSQTVKAAKDGTFSIERVVPGNYTLWLTASPGGAEDTRKAKWQKLLARQNLEVANGDVTGVVLAAASPAAFDGKIAFSGGYEQTFAQMKIAFAPGGEAMFGSYVSANVKADGSFSVPAVDPGEYTVTLQNIPAGSYVQSIQYNHQDVTTSGLDLSDGGGGELDITLRMGAGEVDGTIDATSFGEGQPSGIGVLVPDQIAPDGSGTRVAPVTANGRFVMRNVPPGHYSALLIGRWTGVWQNPVFLREMQRLGVGVDVEENSHVQVQVPLLAPEDVQHTAARLGLDPD
ncbi:MAG: carboxypeptidase regulatory-like domain-containing protein [Acidobacteriaceae bacterium]|nr:carboxypeptidase regulatory-like domain-containing protein [Acidobacteriaceae bacterium]